MDKGKIRNAGRFEQILREDLHFADLMHHHGIEEKSEEKILQGKSSAESSRESSAASSPDVSGTSKLFVIGKLLNFCGSSFFSFFFKFRFFSLRMFKNTEISAFFKNYFFVVCGRILLQFLILNTF